MTTNIKDKNKEDFLAFMRWQIREKTSCGKTKTSANYRSAFRSLNRFLQTQGHEARLAFDQLDCKLLEDYESYLLHERRITRNSSSFYMRVLHSVYNKGVATLGLKQADPFTHVYTGVDKTDKRAISLNAIVKIVQYSGTDQKMEFCRDLFVFSFFARGIAFIDLAKLKKDNLVNGRLVYRRSKTGQLLSVKLEKATRAILRKYEHKETQHLFPILKNDTFTPTSYWSALRAYNYRLKRLAREIGHDIILTSYTPRHSWASEALRLHVPTRVISESMGHSSERTTSIYLTAIDHRDLDSAAKKIIDTIHKRIKTKGIRENEYYENISFFYSTTFPVSFHSTSTQEVDKFDANVDIILKQTK